MTDTTTLPQSDGTLTDGTDAGFWLDWMTQSEIDALPGERKKPENAQVVDRLKSRYKGPPK